MLVLACALVLQSHARAEDFNATAELRDKAAVIDGVADKDEYPAKELLISQTPEREKIQGEAGRAQLFHDGKTLFVAVTIPFKAGTQVSKGESWGTDDGAEICIRDASGTQAGATFVIHGFASGKHECTTDGGAPDDASQKLDKAVKFTAKAGNKSWTGEWSIPLSALGVNYKPGIKLGFNIGAWRSDNSEWIVWRGTQGATYNLDEGGKLTLSDK
jgi:hypothetical protein